MFKSTQEQQLRLPQKADDKEEEEKTEEEPPSVSLPPGVDENEEISATRDDGEEEDFGNVRRDTATTKLPRSGCQIDVNDDEGSENRQHRPGAFPVQGIMNHRMDSFGDSSSSSSNSTERDQRIPSDDANNTTDSRLPAPVAIILSEEELREEYQRHVYDSAVQADTVVNAAEEESRIRRRARWQTIIATFIAIIFCLVPVLFGITVGITELANLQYERGWKEYEIEICTIDGGEKECIANNDELRDFVKFYMEFGCDYEWVYPYCGGLCPLDSWCFSPNVTDFDYLFAFPNYDPCDCGWDFVNDNRYDGPMLTIDGWETSNIVSMEGMFFGNPTFNQPLKNWNMSSVINTKMMFFGATAFNQDLSNWDVSHVRDMSLMFYNASAFNQNLCSWQANNILSRDSIAAPNTSTTDTSGMFLHSGCPFNAEPTENGTFFCRRCSIDRF